VTPAGKGGVPGRRPGPRRRAREVALQLLYGWELTKAVPDEVLTSFWKIEDQPADELAPQGRLFAERLFRGTIEHLSEIDPLIEANAQNWRLSRMAVMDRLILRMAVFELAHDRENPPHVVIDEALELARTFSEADAIRFINGVLDAIQHGLTDPTS
jgi:N utilization substance protein B